MQALKAKLYEFDVVAKTSLVTSVIKSTTIAYGFQKKDVEALAIVIGHKAKDTLPLVRLHSQCIFGDVFSSLKCDCKEQLDLAIEMITAYGYGIIIYLFQEGRGAGLVNKIKGNNLEQKGLDTIEAYQKLHLQIDSRNYSIAGEILNYLKEQEIKLLTNNPDKVSGLKNSNVIVAEIIRLEVEPNEHNKSYLATKKHKMQHMLLKV